jgi:pyruvate,water dikinase
MIVEYPEHHVQMDQFLSWQQAYEAGPGICGGKGYNLARLSRYGFRIPIGGVLPINAPVSQIEAGLERLGLTDAEVAVRSSATGEDSANASFAGIHQSFLRVKGAAAVREKAQKCIASLHTPEAVAYRKRMGFADGDVRCAVVLCEMVNARFAGVAFSVDPLTGRRDRIVIEAVKGLGDALVSGTVSGERITWLNRGGKFTRESGTSVTTMPVDVEEELVHQVIRVQWALGEGQDPQDIEWAFDGEQLWLLQARPVTRFPRSGWRETSAMPRYWSSANIKDAVPGVVCELSWSMICDVVGDTAYAAQKAVGYEMPPGTEVVRRFHGRGYFDLTMMQWAFYDALGVEPAEIVRIVGGSQPTIPVAHGSALKGPNGRRRRMAALRLLWRIWNYPAHVQGATQRQFELGRKLRSKDWAALQKPELLRTLVEITQAQHAFLPVSGLANSCSGPWQMALDALLGDANLIAQLQAGAGGVASAEQGYRIYDIAKNQATLENFLREFGHRAVYEADMLNPRWAEDPSWVVVQVESVRMNPPQADPREAASKVRVQAVKELKLRFGIRSRLALWLIDKLRRAVAAREQAKSGLACLILPFRSMVLEIGRRMQTDGQLDSPEDALHFTLFDISCWLRGYWSGAGARELSADRSARRLKWLSETAPDLIVEDPNGGLAFVVEPTPKASGDREWSGIAAAPGFASGTARIVRNPNDASHLMLGDILVAPSTDPGWTPLFLRASAIIMETGGFLSHGAIVAREFGIPAVANIPGILNSLHDGEQISVDGSAGRVISGLND